MARSVFYYHLKHLKSKDKYEDERKSIRLIFYEHKGRYGYRRVTAEMRNRGYKINHKTVQRLMNEMGLKCKIRKVRYRSYKGEVGKIAPNIIKRNFIATAPNRKWATDVTQINVGTAKLYLSPLWICSMEKLSHTIYLQVPIWSKSTTCWTRLLPSMIVLMVSYSILIKAGSISIMAIVNVWKNII